MQGEDVHIQRSLELARELTVLADEGEAAMEDDSCAVLYGVIRDCAYKIRGMAEKERKEHELQRVAGDASGMRRGHSAVV